MTRRTSEDSDIFRPINWEGFGLACSMAPNADLTMTAKSPPVIIMTPASTGKKILLPPEKAFQTFLVWNMAATALDITVKEDSDTTTIATVSQNEAAIFYCDAALAWHRGIFNAAAT